MPSNHVIKTRYLKKIICLVPLFLFIPLICLSSCWNDTSVNSDNKDTPVDNDTLTIKPLISLGFNENSGLSVGNSGEASPTVTFSKSDTTPSWSTNVPDSGGVSSVDFGTSIGDYYVESAEVITELGGLTAFTVTGWVNNRIASTGSGGNRIVSWINDGGEGVDIVYKNNGALQVGIDQWPDTSLALSSVGKIPTDINASAENWTFFAVTYDTSTVGFYFGNRDSAASLDQSVSYNRGAVGTSIGKLAVGHFNTESKRSERTDRMFKGLIDQVEIYGRVLTGEEIIKVQKFGK